MPSMTQRMPGPGGGSSMPGLMAPPPVPPRPSTMNSYNTFPRPSYGGYGTMGMGMYGGTYRGFGQYGMNGLPEVSDENGCVLTTKFYELLCTTGTGSVLPDTYSQPSPNTTVTFIPCLAVRVKIYVWVTCVITNHGHVEQMRYFTSSFSMAHTVLIMLLQITLRFSKQRNIFATLCYHELFLTQQFCIR